MSKWIRVLLAATVAAVFLPAFADRAPPVSDSTPVDGLVQLSGGAVAAGIGYTWGDGTLAFGNTQHKFSLKGLSVVDVGATGITASGSVYHLAKLSDFDGNYVAVSAGLTVAGGGDAVYLRNQHGVVIKLTSTAVGLRFNFAGSGVNISLQD